MDIIDSIEEIAKVFISQNTTRIRYSDIDFIPEHHKALLEMKSLGLVYILFEGNKVFIDKTFD